MYVQYVFHHDLLKENKEDFYGKKWPLIFCYIVAKNKMFLFLQLYTRYCNVVQIKKGVYLMNKKQLVIAMMAAVLSITGANAQSYISDVTNGGSGTFNIDPAKVNGDVGYRAYDNFTVGSDDVANLNFDWSDGRAINAFINLVQSGVNVQGIVNTVKGNDFYNGHAIFITPNGLTVGASGVLNVGRLSVATPTPQAFTNLMSEYNASTFKPENINKISNLLKDGNAKIDVKGYVFTRNGADLSGSQIDVSGKIVNGMTASYKINATNAAENLFNSLVNTDGTMKDNVSVQSNGSLVYLRSFDKGSNAGINVSGVVSNLTAGPDSTNHGSVALTNAGANGITVSGNIAANGKLSLYNKKGDMSLTGNAKLTSKNGLLSVTNGEDSLNSNAGSLTIGGNVHLNNTNGGVSIVNNGKGALNHSGNVETDGALNIFNNANNNKANSSALTVAGTNNADTVRILNKGSNLAITGNAEGRTVSVRNYGNGGMSVGGTLTATEGVLVDNYAGNANLNGNIEVTNGNVAIMNRAGKLTLDTNSDIKNTGNSGGFIAIKNEGNGGMELNGSIYNKDGETAINNHAGAMTVNGEITNSNGNMAIRNRGEGAMTVDDVEINNKGTLRLANEKGSSFTITENANVKNNGQMSVYNDKGLLTINGTLKNQNGDLYVLSQKESTGIVTGDNDESAIIVEGSKGGLSIKHKGTKENGVSMNLNGTIQNDVTGGQTGINNYGTGKMIVNGTIKSKGDMGIINRSDGQEMTVNAKIYANGSETNIKNDGKGNMTVGGTINHTGRLNILGNEKQLILDGTINNQNTENNGYLTMTYAASRSNGTGITATENFRVNSTNGDVLIKNITGSNGLNFAGNINSTNGQAEIYNKAGDMTVQAGAVVDGAPNQSFIFNTGRGLVVQSVDLPSDIMIVNKGSVSAKDKIPAKYNNNNNFREKLKDNN